MEEVKKNQEIEQVAKSIEFSKQLSPEVIAEISKFALDVKDLKSQTIPNPVVLGGMEAIGINRIAPWDIPLYLLMHPALPRGIEIKANRMIRLVKEDLKSNVLINPTADDKKTIEFEDGTKFNHKEMATQARDYCKKITYDSGGPLFLKGYAQDAYRFGTSFVVLQKNEAESEVLRFEVQHPIFFGPARYPTKIKGPGIDWNNVPQDERDALAGKMKIDPKTKKISKYTQLTKKYPNQSENNYKPSSGEYVNTRTNPNLKEKNAGPLVPIGGEIDQDHVIQLMFDRIGDEPLGISLVQFLHLTIKYLLNMEKAAAQTMVNFGFNKWIANTPFKDIKKMQAFGKTLANLQVDSVVILPEGITLNNVVPGITEFDRMHPIYLRLIAMRLGIPMPILTQDGTTTNKACYSEDTEVLTDKGWKYHWEVKKGDNLVQYNSRDEILEEIPFNGKRFVYDVDEELYHFKNKSNDILVTEKHRMLCKEYRSDKYEIIPAEKIKYDRIRVKSTSSWNSKVSPEFIKISKDLNIELDDYLEFIGYYLSEGGFSREPLKEGGRKIYNITFAEHNKNNRIKKFFDRLLEKYGIYAGSYQNNKYDITHFNLCNKEIWTHLLNEEYGTKFNEKRIPRWILDLSKDKLKILLDALIHGDGTTYRSKLTRKIKGHVYYTCSKQLSDDVQELAFKCGYTTNNKLHYEGNTYKKSETAYRVFINFRKNLCINRKQIIKEKYIGKVFCFEVPSGIFVTRRNGLIAIQGNTMQEQRKDMWDDFIADELTIEVSMNEGFFKACQIKWPELTIEELNAIVPKFNFDQPPEDIDIERERDLKFTLAVRNLSNAADIWTQIGDERVLALLSIKTRSVIERSMELDFMKEEEMKKEEQRMLKLISTKQKLISSGKSDDDDIDQQIDDLKEEEEAAAEPPKEEKKKK